MPPNPSFHVAAAIAPMLTLNVRYTLSEYLAVVDAFIPYALTAKKDKSAAWEVHCPTVRAGWATKTLTKCIASGAFFYKVSRVGDCRFTFSDTGLVREAKNGRMQVPWPEITRVFRLPTAFLFAKAKGAMPVPYSCMSEQERAVLEQLLAQVGHGPNDAP